MTDKDLDELLALVNDYERRYRDSEVRSIFMFLGMLVKHLIEQQPPPDDT